MKVSKGKEFRMNISFCEYIHDKSENRKTENIEHHIEFS